MAENMSYYEYIPHTDRLDYISPMANNVAWVLAVEKLAGIEAPKRAQYIRMMIAELARIASHLVAIRAFAKGMGSEAANFIKLDQVDPQVLQAEFQKLKSDGLTICPTIITFKVFTKNNTFMTGNYPMSEYISQAVLDNWINLWSGQSELPDFIWQNWAKMVSELYKAGVPLMTGTDLSTPGTIPGYSLHAEMSAWQDAGIHAAGVLRSATLIPAQFMGFGDRLGSVAEGKTASLILVRANPLEDIDNAQQIEAVFLKGQRSADAAIRLGARR